MPTAVVDMVDVLDGSGFSVGSAEGSSSGVGSAEGSGAASGIGFTVGLWLCVTVASVSTGTKKKENKKIFSNQNKINSQCTTQGYHSGVTGFCSLLRNEAVSMGKLFQTLQRIVRAEMQGTPHTKTQRHSPADFSPNDINLTL
jgi:hypothetical protein